MVRQQIIEMRKTAPGRGDKRNRVLMGYGTDQAPIPRGRQERTSELI